MHFENRANWCCWCTKCGAYWTGNARRFRRDEVDALREDLRELMGERGIVTVGQQLSIVQRALRSYSFLQMRSARLLGGQ